MSNDIVDVIVSFMYP